MYKLLALSLVCALAAPALANGREPGPMSIVVQPGNDQHVLLGATFGLVVSKDGGATWNWMCENAVGYAGTYDPDYAWSPAGTMFATTFSGLKVMRAPETCGFSIATTGAKFISRIDVANDGTTYIASVDPSDSNIYKSTDDGMTFPTSAQPGVPGDWWSAIMAAPSSSQRVYLTGYRYTNTAGAKDYLLFTSADGGVTYTEMSKAGISPTSMNSIVDIAGISPTNDQTLFVHVTFENGASGDSVYRSTDAGQNWTKILTKNSSFGLSFLVRHDGTCIAATRDQGAWHSTDCATAATPTWTPMPNAPHIGCLAGDSQGTVYACTNNFPSTAVGLPSDGFGIMKTTDLTTWTGALKFQDIAGPVDCAAGTLVQDTCVQKFMERNSAWCCLADQFDITSGSVDCTGDLKCGDSTTNPGDSTGCCESGAGASSLMMSTIVLGLIVLRRRRPRRSAN